MNFTQSARLQATRSIKHRIPAMLKVSYADFEQVRLRTLDKSLQRARLFRSTNVHLRPLLLLCVLALSAFPTFECSSAVFKHAGLTASEKVQFKALRSILNGKPATGKATKSKTPREYLRRRNELAIKSGLIRFDSVTVAGTGFHELDGTYSFYEEDKQRITWQKRNSAGTPSLDIYRSIFLDGWSFSPATSDEDSSPSSSCPKRVSVFPLSKWRRMLLDWTEKQSKRERVTITTSGEFATTLYVPPDDMYIPDDVRLSTGSATPDREE